MLDFLFGKNSEKSAVLESPYFPEHAIVDDVRLNRNGVGTRTKLGIKVYDMALYIGGSATTPEEVLRTPGPKQIRFIARRTMGGHDLAAAMLTGIRLNLSEKDHARFMPYTGQVVAVFKSQDKVLAGHTFRVDLFPDRGAHFYIDDEPKAKPIKADGFNEAILNIWLGPKPADETLKRNLLKPKKA